MATSYSNYGGNGNRIGEMQVTFSGTLVASTGRVENLVEGNNSGATSATSLRWTGGQSAVTLRFDWGVGASIVIDEITWYQNANTDQGSWVVEGSDDASSWTTLQTFTMNTSGGQVVSWSNSTGYRYYQLRHSSGNTLSSTPWIQEIEFKLEDLDPTARCSYGNTLGTGNRTASITTSTSFTGNVAGGGLGAGHPNFVDGAFADNYTDSTDWNANTDKVLAFDFGVGVSKVIDGFRFAQSSQLTQGSGWLFEGSNDGSAWDDLTGGAPFALTPGGTELGLTQKFFPHHFPNTTGYRHYRIRGPQASGGSGTTTVTPWLRELEFRIQDAGAAVDSAKVPKLSGYGVIESPGPVRIYKHSAYAVLQEPILAASVPKLSGYTVLELPLANRVPKLGGYGVLESPGPVRVYKHSAYAVLEEVDGGDLPYRLPRVLVINN